MRRISHVFRPQGMYDYSKLPAYIMLPLSEEFQVFVVGSGDKEVDNYFPVLFSPLRPLS